MRWRKSFVLAIVVATKFLVAKLLVQAFEILVDNGFGVVMDNASCHWLVVIIALKNRMKEKLPD